jgi:hypothetical protein
MRHTTTTSDCTIHQEELLTFKHSRFNRSLNFQPNQNLDTYTILYKNIVTHLNHQTNKQRNHVYLCRLPTYTIQDWYNLDLPLAISKQMLDSCPCSSFRTSYRRCRDENNGSYNTVGIIYYEYARKYSGGTSNESP